VSAVLMATVFGMALGGWLSGMTFDLTGSYQAAFLNGILWNLLNLAIAVTLLRRPGTPAAQMPQVHRAIAKERARRLREKGETALRRHLDQEIGGCRRVMAESRALGRTEQFVPVRLARPTEPGVTLDLTMTGHDGRQLLAA